MRNKNMLFSELGGFVIYDRLVLNKYLEKKTNYLTQIFCLISQEQITEIQ